MRKQDIDVIAKDLGVTVDEVLQMEQRLNASDASIDVEDNDDANAMVARQLHAPNADPAMIVQQERDESYHHARLQVALSSLDERSQAILRARWLQDESSTLHDLAIRYGVSAERIRQLEKNALEKLKKIMQT
jgi:RNA polymerase sigma-32 factor